MHNRAAWLIETLGLQPHPEGGYYREAFRSSLVVFSESVNTRRNAMTHIYFLLTKNQISRLHRVRHDELWIYQEGAELLIHSIDGTSHKHSESKLGLAGERPVNLSTIEDAALNRTEPAVIISSNTWQAAQSLGAFTFVSCIVAPGFEFQDFSLLKDCDEEQEAILKFWPDALRFI